MTMRAAWLVLCACSAPAHPAAPAAPPVAKAPHADVWAAEPAEPDPIDTRPAWIGIWPDPKSTRVLQVVRGGPADQAGVAIGDEIVSIDGQAVGDGRDVVRVARALGKGKAAPVVVRRTGNELTLHVVPRERPEIMSQTLAGKPAPPFALAGPDGAPVKLTDRAGHVVVVEFWATWCGPCAMTAPKLEQWHRKYGELRVVGITDEDAATVQKHLAAHPLAYPIALDLDAVTTRDYLVEGLPTILVIDKANVVRYVHVGVPDFADLEAKIVQLMN